jgi:uncharacterized membrane protein required for colicin V production
METLGQYPRVFSLGQTDSPFFPVYSQVSQCYTRHQENAMGFNWIDFVLIGLLLVGLAVGYAQGFVRQLVGLAGIYVALVLATQFFVPLTLMFSSLTNTPPTTLSNMVCFFVILFTVMFIINLLGKDAYRSTKLKILPFADHLLGMVVGVVSMWILVAVIVNVLAFSVNTANWGGQAEPYRLMLENGVNTSQIYQVTGSTLPMIVATIRVWFPGPFPAIFEL